MKSLALALVLASSVSAAGAASAAPPAAPASADAATERFDAMLRVIDVVPDRVALERGWPDARARLLTAAADPQRDDWTRMRATSLLSFFPDAEVRASLLALASSPRADVRRTALYAAARTFGAPGDPALVAAVEARLADPDARVREQAVRALRWIDHVAAGRLLARLAGSGADDELAGVARLTEGRRATRLATRGQR